MKWNPMGAALLLFFIFGEAGVEDTVVSTRWLGGL
jgi:hypothetical protein